MFCALASLIVVLCVKAGGNSFIFVVLNKFVFMFLFFFEFVLWRRSLGGGARMCTQPAGAPASSLRP